MSTIIIDLQYLPTLEYFCCLSKADRVVFEACEFFERQSFRNRTEILSTNGISRLSIPVLGGNKKIIISKIQVDHKQKWINNHWRAIQSAYGKAPYFEYYSSYFQDIFNESELNLFQFNHKLLTICLKLLELDIPYEFSKTYLKTYENSIKDLRSTIHPKKSFSENNFYQPVKYIQLFGNEFVSNMSVLDLLFCEGPNASNILKQSTIA